MRRRYLLDDDGCYRRAPQRSIAAGVGRIIGIVFVLATFYAIAFGG